MFVPFGIGGHSLGLRKAVVSVVVPGHNTVGVDGPRWRGFLGLCQPQATRRNAVGVGTISILLFPVSLEEEEGFT